MEGTFPWVIQHSKCSYRGNIELRLLLIKDEQPAWKIISKDHRHLQRYVEASYQGLCAGSVSPLKLPLHLRPIDAW